MCFSSPRLASDYPWGFLWAFPCLALPCLALPCLALFFLAFPLLALPCLSFQCLSLHCLFLPCLAFPCMAFPCLAFLFSALPCLALPCLALPCLASHLLSQLCVALYLLSNHQSCLASVNLPTRSAVGAIKGSATTGRCTINQGGAWGGRKGQFAATRVCITS